ncbi:unnamed protein product, partial [Wuchereria bancrofti]
MGNQQSKSHNRILMIRLVRIIAWFIAFEIILHFIHVHAVLVIGPALFDTLNEYE